MLLIPEAKMISSTRCFMSSFSVVSWCVVDRKFYNYVEMLQKISLAVIENGFGSLP